MRRRDALLVDRLADARGREVAFVSHCLLNENVRYLGGAFHAGAVPEIVELVRSGTGIVQLPCPEQRAWGGVLKRRMLRGYGLRASPLYPLARLALPLFVWQTRVRYRLLARRVARDIEDYRAAGMRVAGVIGVGASPSCGVATTLDMRSSFRAMAACPLATMDRARVNDQVVSACRVAGEGLFVAALRRELTRRGIDDVPFSEFDLIAEMRLRPQPPLSISSPARAAASSRAQRSARRGAPARSPAHRPGRR